MLLIPERCVDEPGLMERDAPPVRRQLHARGRVDFVQVAKRASSPVVPAKRAPARTRDSASDVDVANTSASFETDTAARLNPRAVPTCSVTGSAVPKKASRLVSNGCTKR